MYCNYNAKLFKRFTSIKKKITPELADDWKIQPKGYNTIGGMMLRSEKLDQTVADIDMRRFLQFLEEQQLELKGLSIKGNYIIGNDRSFYTEEMYNTWKDKYEKKVSTEISKKDLIVGQEYESICGGTFFYLGSYYVIKHKSKSIKNKDSYQVSLTKQKLTHLVYVGDSYRYVQELKQKVVKKTKNVLSDIELAKTIKEFQSDWTVAYCKKEKLADPKIVLTESKTPNTIDNQHYFCEGFVSYFNDRKLLVVDRYNFARTIEVENNYKIKNAYSLEVLDFETLESTGISPGDLEGVRGRYHNQRTYSPKSFVTITIE